MSQNVEAKEIIVARTFIITSGSGRPFTRDIFCDDFYEDSSECGTSSKLNKKGESKRLEPMRVAFDHSSFPSVILSYLNFQNFQMIMAVVKLW